MCINYLLLCNYSLCMPSCLPSVLTTRHVFTGNGVFEARVTQESAVSLLARWRDKPSCSQDLQPCRASERNEGARVAGSKQNLVE